MKSSTPLTRPAVLLVEDTMSLQMVYRSILATAGHRVAVAATAEEGLSQFRAHRPMVVLLDLILPDRDGLEVMKEIQAIQPETRVIAITANGSVNRAVEAMRAGAHDFLVKPFDEGDWHVDSDAAPMANPLADVYRGLRFRPLGHPGLSRR